MSAGADGAHTNVTDDGVGTTGTWQLLYSAYPWYKNIYTCIYNTCMKAIVSVFKCTSKRIDM